MQNVTKNALRCWKGVGLHGKVRDGGDAGERLLRVRDVVGRELGVLNVAAKARRQPKRILI